jgi:hypothetical protein
MCTDWQKTEEYALVRNDGTNFQKILETEPDSSPAYEGLARVDVARKDYVKALVDARKSSRLNA